MAQRRHRAERAFEHYLRSNRVPYVAVNEARKSLLPAGARLLLTPPGNTNPEDHNPSTLKNFDFIVYGEGFNLLIEVKGRTIPKPKREPLPGRRPRLECWVTEDDIAALDHWERLFGPGYESVFVFLYACQGPPPDGIFGEVIEYDGAWFAIRAITLSDYRSCTKPRSAKWRTVHLHQADFERLSRPFSSGRGSQHPRDDLEPALPRLGT